MPKKKIVEAVPVAPINDDSHRLNDDSHRLEIQPLELSIDLGRQDLNDAVGKLQAKINEVIAKLNS